MAKNKKPTLFEGLMQGLAETAAYLNDSADKGEYRVHVPGKVDVKQIRKGLHLTQDQFAETFGFSAARVKDWEQERSAPDPAVRAYLTVIRREPKAVLAILAQADEEEADAVVATPIAKAKAGKKKSHRAHRENRPSA